MKELGAKRKNELHENIQVTNTLAEQERDELVCRKLDETMQQRCLRLAKEYENIALN